MWCNIVLILIVFMVAFIGFAGYSSAKDNSENGSPFEQLSRVELNQKLEQLPQNPDGWREPVSAMCYDTAAPLDRDQYICPECGEMTLYPILSNSSYTLDHISHYRNLVKKITKIDVKLDESQFCQRCSPTLKDHKLCIIVKHDEKSEPHKTCDITEEDINLLYEYSEGMQEKQVYVGKVPISTYIDRLEELLGVKVKDNGK